MATLGDFLNSINLTKNDILSEDPDAEKDYIPFVVNRSLSYFADTAIIANEMNRRHLLPKKMQYDFLVNTVRARKRFKRWDKKMADDRVQLVKQYYGVSEVKARQILIILSEEQIEQIKEALYTGGVG